MHPNWVLRLSGLGFGIVQERREFESSSRLMATTMVRPAIEGGMMSSLYGYLVHGRLGRLDSITIPNMHFNSAGLYSLSLQTNIY